MPGATPYTLPVNAGAESWSGHSQLPRHRHRQPYAALTVGGGYAESGGRGRYQVRAGQVLLHRMFDAHLNRFAAGGARIVNLPLAADPGFGLGQVADPDLIVRLAERDPAAAAVALERQLEPLAAPAADWPDLLAAALRADPGLGLADWAQRHGLAAATVSRGFARVFGVSPAAFRLETRTQQALALIAGGCVALADVALRSGFSDQAHMTRAVSALTGCPPRHWQVKSVQAAARPRDL
jgi:AraC-like DNA-binding protein